MFGMLGLAFPYRVLGGPLGGQGNLQQKPPAVVNRSLGYNHCRTGIGQVHVYSFPTNALPMGFCGHIIKWMTECASCNRTRNHKSVNDKCRLKPTPTNTNTVCT